MKLKGKVALITGAGRGIGRGIAEVFAGEGADVAVNDFDNSQQAEDVAAAIRSSGRRAVVVKADVAKRAEVEPMVARVWKELGPIDVLVNNAGIETIVPFLELTDEQWTRLVDVNLRGAWLCSQVFCRRAVAEGRKGSIVNIGSIQAAKVLPGRTHYAPTKLGLEALTRNMSAEMTPQGIRVNCIHPGLDRHADDRLGHEGSGLAARRPRANLSGARRRTARDWHCGRIFRFRRCELLDRAVDLRGWGMAGEIVVGR